MTIAACTECFHNHGFRQVVAMHGSKSETPCPHCGSSSGITLTSEALSTAARDFFVTGSIVSEMLAPYYQVNSNNPHPALLDSTVASDAEKLKAIVGLTVFNYGPPLWQVGITSHWDDFQDLEPSIAADKLVQQAAQMIVPAGTVLYRVRLNVTADHAVTDPRTFDPPPSHVKRVAGRWDDGTNAVLYVADDIELCLHECRATLSDEITLATLVTVRDLRILDVSSGFEDRGSTRFEDGQLFSDFMSRSRSEPWLEICRAIGSAARRAGYDGVRYTSYYSFAMDECSGLNLALFDRPISDGRLRIHSANRLRLTSVKYGYGVGPTLFSEQDADWSKIL